MQNENFIAKDGSVNYDFLISKFSWLVEDNLPSIVSPDTDGILCGLFMTHYLNWNIVGFYDGKQLAIRHDIHPEDCIFMDMEIFRREVKSTGHHMLLYNKNYIPGNWGNFSNCVNPNILRSHDVSRNFKEKYPFGMIHFLISVVSFKKEVEVPETAIPALLYADGTFKNLLNYPENCVSWLNFLRVKDSRSPMYPFYLLFAKIKLASMIHDLENIFSSF
ncbi:MAG: hypothetical protein NC906_08120, partial [Candidatus Omnitrophica bacterium]|nr:hypothetical protein [Candidatus Omnitrophota bacterium]